MKLLTDNLENMVCMIEQSKDLSILTDVMLVGSLEAHKQQKKKKWEPLEK